MATTDKRVTFTFKELAEILSKEANIKSGHWGIYVRFGLGASNVGETASDLKPAAIVPVVEIGIQEFQAPNSLTIDAATARKS